MKRVESAVGQGVPSRGHKTHFLFQEFTILQNPYFYRHYYNYYYLYAPFLWTTYLLSTDSVPAQFVGYINEDSYCRRNAVRTTSLRTEFHIH
jgi:hypothetical protein